MENNYVLVMIQSLEEKLSILELIIDKNMEQSQIAKEDTFNTDAFDKNVGEKEELIKKLNRLDRGFQSLYDHVKEMFKSETEKKKYSEQILTMQNLITIITEKSVEIQAQENSNKNIIEAVFRREKELIKKSKVGTKAATDYYRTMNKANLSQSYFLDEKN